MDVNLVTKQGYERMLADLEELKGKRREVAVKIGTARELGDLSENAEFHAAVEEQALLEARIRKMERTVKNSKVMADTDLPDGQINIGSTVKVRDLATGREDLVLVLGEGEAKFDPDAEVLQVSSSSPVGEALYKARVGDKVGVRTPKGRTEYEIIEVE